MQITTQMNKIATFLLCFSLAPVLLSAQPQQMEIPRITQMPDMPSPYFMRDWERVAERYDTLVFSMEQEGTHFPLLSLGDEGVNYPEIKPIFLDSYVGSSSHGEQREAINILPALVGASLLGIDKTSQFEVNWVDKARDFYNLANGELVYLNGPSDRSGHDWWYETMPNIFFYQLYDLYPNTTGFEAHFRSVADRWLEAVMAMGGETTPWAVPEMNYRAWNLKEMKPLDEGVKEPEAAGAIAWILYQAHKTLGDPKYLIGAQWCMEFLNNLESNPSYELQLPYGVLAAAKMNAEVGTNYDLEKMINWCFDRGDLRGWGSIVGTWDGIDVSGLIGEANDQGDDYAFVMNGYQQAAALVPLIKYDKRFAAPVAKWVLNMANASRLFYSDALPSSQQSDYDWSAAHDPHSVIAYEALKENWEGTALYARGDARDAGWAETNFALYGSSHVGYLAAIVEQTDVEGILKLDLNATDFFEPNAFPTYALYNPFGESKQVSMLLEETPKDIYDAISETILLENASGEIQLTIPPKEVLLISYIPTGATLQEADGRLIVNDTILDYHYGYDFTPKLRINALSATSNPTEIGIPDTIYCTVDPTGEATFQWLIDGVDQQVSEELLIWTPEETGIAMVKVIVQKDGATVTDSLELEVVDLIPQNPVIDSIWTANTWQAIADEIWVIAKVHDPKGLDLTWEWSFEQGQILETAGDSVKLRLPEVPGVFPVTLTVTNSYDKSETQVFELLVLENPAAIDPLIYLPLNGDTDDRSGNDYETHLQGTSFVADAREEEAQALSFTSSADELLIPNDPSLNFTGGITISFWASVNDFSEERFIISHGGWEQRWKASVTTEGKLRWTVNTTDGIKDLDSRLPLERFEWNHYVLMYSGSSMTLYVNGVLDSFTAHSGDMNPSGSALVIGKRLSGDAQYHLKGRVDEVKLFDRAVGPGQAEQLRNQWAPPQLLQVKSTTSIHLYPNPASQSLSLSLSGSTKEVKTVELYNLAGQRLASTPMKGTRLKIDLPYPHGIYLIRIIQQGTVLGMERLLVE